MVEKTLYLISGMPGTGKSTFADFFSKTSKVPLISYDRIAEHTMKIVDANCKDKNLHYLFGSVAYDFLWFNCEELMKCSIPVIVDYIFNEMSVSIIENLKQRYEYNVINIHFDCDAQIAYERYCKNISIGTNIRHQVSYENFEKISKQNKDFKYGDKIINVESSCFEKLNYKEILDTVKQYA